jgi:L-rhamnose isomerase / sugar isomerase
MAIAWDVLVEREWRRSRGGAVDPVAVYRASQYRQQLARERPADLRRGGGIV